LVVVVNLHSDSSPPLPPLLWCCVTLQDHEELYGLGVAAIFGPGTRIPAAAMDMIQLLVGGDEEGPPQEAAAGGKSTSS